MWNQMKMSQDLPNILADGVGDETKVLHSYWRGMLWTSICIGAGEGQVIGAIEVINRVGHNGWDRWVAYDQ